MIMIGGMILQEGQAVEIREDQKAEVVKKNQVAGVLEEMWQQIQVIHLRDFLLVLKQTMGGPLLVERSFMCSSFLERVLPPQLFYSSDGT